MTLKSICRIKGQEENTLQGLGIVVGLKGTGDGGTYLPTIRSLAKVMSVMDMPTPTSKAGLVDLKDTKNVALVIVTATVPGAGARQGDKLDCVVSSVGSAKSLAGGRLFMTPLIGPDPRNRRVFGFAEGPITLEDPRKPPPAASTTAAGWKRTSSTSSPRTARSRSCWKRTTPTSRSPRTWWRSINSQMRHADEQLGPHGPRHQSRQHRGHHSAAVQRRSGVVRLPGAGAAADGAADRGPGGGQSSGPAASSSAATLRSAPWPITHKNIVIETAGGGAGAGVHPSSPSIPSIPAPRS